MSKNSAKATERRSPNLRQVSREARREQQHFSDTRNLSWGPISLSSVTFQGPGSRGRFGQSNAINWIDKRRRGLHRRSSRHLATKVACGDFQTGQLRSCKAAPLERRNENRRN